MEINVINNRSRNIILEIIQRKTVKTSDLALKYHVSERSIRLDLDEIDYFLKENKCYPLIRKGRRGVSIEDDPAITNLIYKLINEKDIVTQTYSQEERILEILFILWCAKKPIKIEQLAELIFVSKSSIVKDIERLKSSLYDSFEIKGSSDGLEIEGDEFEIRRSIVKTYVESMDKLEVINLIRLIINKDEKITFTVYWRLFEDVDLPIVIEIIEQLRIIYSSNLSDIQYLQVMGNLCLMIKRIRNGRVVFANDEVVSCPITEYSIDYVTGVLSKYLGQKIPDSERRYIQYICYLVCPEVYMIEHPDEKEKAENAFDFIVQLMIDYKLNDEIYCRLHKDVMNMYCEEKLGLVSPVSNIGIKNELYLRFYQIVSSRIGSISFIERELDSDFYWRIAIHYIFQNSFGDTRTKNVLILSDKSETMSDMLISQLRSLYDVRIVGVTGTAKLHESLCTLPVDIIVSTLKIDIDGYTVAKVHPLLGEMGKNYLKSFFDPKPSHDTNMRYHDTQLVVSEVEVENMDELCRYVQKLLRDNESIDFVSSDFHINQRKSTRNQAFVFKNNLIVHTLYTSIINHDVFIKVELKKEQSFGENAFSRLIVINCKDRTKYINYINKL